MSTLIDYFSSFTSCYRIKKTDASKLQDEYAKLVEGLQDAANDEDAFMSNPGLSCSIMTLGIEVFDATLVYCQCCRKISSKRLFLVISGRPNTSWLSSNASLSI